MFQEIAENNWALSLWRWSLWKSTRHLTWLIFTLFHIVKMQIPLWPLGQYWSTPTSVQIFYSISNNFCIYISNYNKGSLAPAASQHPFPPQGSLNTESSSLCTAQITHPRSPNISFAEGSNPRMCSRHPAARIIQSCCLCCKIQLCIFIHVF